MLSVQRRRYNDGMSDNRPNSPAEEAEYSGPLRRFKPIARIVFGTIALFFIAVFAMGFLHVAVDIWKESSRSIARTDWSWWTWPRVLSAFLALLGIAILVLNRIRIARRRSGR
jgi:H+/Cl- antiporter ClcA